jgi:hypothetical protein
MMVGITGIRRVPSSVAPIAIGAVAVAGCAVVAMNNPSNSTFLPCTFREMTGLPCPGCGATRAAYQLMHGNLGAALGFNAVAVLLVFPLMIGFYLAWAIPRMGGPELVRLRMPKWLAFGLLGITLAWWVVRLLPFQPFLGLRV